MRQRQNMWLPLVAGIGIGAAASGMMRGRGGKMAQMMPGMNKQQDASNSQYE